jgi:hypothetical protein
MPIYSLAWFFSLQLHLDRKGVVFNLISHCWLAQQVGDRIERCQSANFLIDFSCSYIASELLKIVILLHLCRV